MMFFLHRTNTCEMVGYAINILQVKLVHKWHCKFNLLLRVSCLLNTFELRYSQIKIVISFVMQLCRRYIFVFMHFEILEEKGKDGFLL